MKAIRKVEEIEVADLELMGAENTKSQSVALDDLVVVAEFRDTIYPGLVSTGKVHRGGDKPLHTVINGENLRDRRMVVVLGTVSRYPT